MPGMPARPPNMTWKNEHTQLGAMAEGGFVTTEYWSECWSCGEVSHQCKPGAIHDIWRCACGVEWNTPSYERLDWLARRS